MLAKEHTPPKRAWIAGIFLATLLAYVLWTPQVLHYTQPPSGDQPYYLMTTISLVEDRDLNQYNNYRKDASYDQFYPPFGGAYPSDFPGIPAPYPLPSEGHMATATNRPPNTRYSKHGLGVPLLIIPGWVLGKALTPLLSRLILYGNGGWPAVVFQFNLLGALSALQVFLLAWEVAGKRWIALAVWAALAFSNPQMSYSYLVFPELPAALLILYAFRRLRLGWETNTPVQLLSVALSISYLPWLHNRLLPIVLALTAYSVYQWRRTRPSCRKMKRRQWRSLLLFLAPILISGGAMAAYHCWLYGSPLPNVQDHAGFFNPLHAKGRLSLLLSTLGLLLDQQWGLLPYTPVLALSAVGTVVLMGSREGRQLGAWLGMIMLPYFLVVAAYKVWWGAWCPPARYLAPITPLMAVPLAISLQAAERRITYKFLYALLTGIGIAIMGALLTNLDYRTSNGVPILFNHPTGEGSFFVWLASRLGIDLKPFIPALVPWFVAEEHPVPWRPLWISVGALGVVVSIGLLCIGGNRAGKRTKSTQKISR
ncbi:MAG: hypothetical protein R6V13_01630 [Anaerolineae bacterium]